MSVLDSLTRGDMIERAMALIEVRHRPLESNELKKQLWLRDVRASDSVELRKLYFETVQYVHYLGNYGDGSLTEHDDEVEHPIWTKDVWVPLRRSNFTQLGYWEWVFNEVKNDQTW